VGTARANVTAYEPRAIRRRHEDGFSSRYKGGQDRAVLGVDGGPLWDPEGQVHVGSDLAELVGKLLDRPPRGRRGGEEARANSSAPKPVTNRWRNSFRMVVGMRGSL
jgi:hypothetical protein